MIARRPSRIAAKKAFDASELKEDSFQWQRLPAELRQTILVHVINNVLNRYLEPKHAKHKAATDEETEASLIALLETFSATTPGDYPVALSMALAKLRPELKVMQKNYGGISRGRKVRVFSKKRSTISAIMEKLDWALTALRYTAYDQTVS